jgi:hypothetical protein
VIIRSSSTGEIYRCRTASYELGSFDLHSAYM